MEKSCINPGNVGLLQGVQNQDTWLDQTLQTFGQPCTMLETIKLYEPTMFSTLSQLVIFTWVGLLLCMLEILISVLIRVCNMMSLHKSYSTIKVGAG